jgi:hypothetical protein
MAKLMGPAVNQWDIRTIKKISPGSGFCFLCVFLFQYLLSSATTSGYDAQMQHVLKKLAVTALIHDDDDDKNIDADPLVVQRATQDI